MRYIESQQFYDGMDKAESLLEGKNSSLHLEGISPKDMQKFNQEGLLVINVAAKKGSLGLIRTRRELLGRGFGWTREKTTKAAVPVTLATALVLSACGPSGEAGDDETETATPTKTATSTFIPTQNTETPPPTVTPTESEVFEPEILGNGAYNSIEENPNFSEAQQTTIEKLLGESTPMVIGERSILSVKNKVTEPHNALTETGELLPAPELDRVSANKMIKDAVSRQDELALLGLYFAYMAKNPDSGITFEEYKSSSDKFDSMIWAYPGVLPETVDPFPFNTNAITDVPFNKDAIVVWDILDTPEKTSIYIVNDMRMMVIAENNVIYIGLYAHDPAALDFNGQHRKNSEITELIALVTTMLGKKEARNTGVSIFPYSLDIGSLYPNTEFDKLRQQAREISIPIRQDKEQGGNIGIHSVVGVSAKTGNPVNSISDALSSRP